MSKRACDYLIKLGGKFRGKKLSEVPIKLLEQYIEWFEKNANPAEPKLQELKNQLEKFKQVSKKE